MPRENVHRRNRRNLQASQGATAAVITAANTVAATKWRLTLSAPVQVVQVPTDFLVNGAPATAVTVVSPTVIDLTYTIAVATGQAFVIPANSPSIRTQRGGVVAAAAGVFP